MKHALHFATKLNSRDIQKCNNCFWVPSYDLFASAHKEVFSCTNGIQRGHLCFLSWLTITAQEEEDVPRVHPLQVEFKYTVRGQGIMMCNHDWWEGAWGEVICHKKVKQSFLNQSLDPPHPSPNKKILDPPLQFQRSLS